MGQQDQDLEAQQIAYLRALPYRDWTGSDVTQARLLLNMTQADLAHAIGYSRGGIGKIEGADALEQSTVLAVLHLMHIAGLGQDQAQVFSYRVWDQMKGDWHVSRVKATGPAIAIFRGEVLPGGGEWVDKSELDGQGRHEFRRDADLDASGVDRDILKRLQDRAQALQNHRGSLNYSEAAVAMERDLLEKAVDEIERLRVKAMEPVSPSSRHYVGFQRQVRP